MNVFIAIAVLLTLLVTAWLIYPLLRSRHSNGVSSEGLNAAIHRDQLRGLETDLARGVINQSDFEATRDELQLRLLEDIQSTEKTATSAEGFWSSKRTAIGLGLSAPVLALALYLQLGTPAAIDPLPQAQADEVQVRQMIDTLAAKLKANPDNPKGWAMLARSYKVMQRFDEAEQAFIKAGELVNSEPDLLVDYADLLAMRANDIEGRPLEMVNKALLINPKHPTALMISAVAAYRRADYKMAVGQWEKLLIELEPGSPDAMQIQGEIDNAREKAGMPVQVNSTSQSGKLPPVPAGAAQGMNPEMINQMVERLATRLKANPDDITGWANLARAYKVQGRLEDAIAAYEKTGKLLDTDADLLTQYADVVATRAKGEFKGKAQQLIEKALSINPQHPMALMMAGQSAYKSADYKKAIAHWEKVLQILPANSSEAGLVKGEIADAKAKLSQ